MARLGMVGLLLALVASPAGAQRVEDDAGPFSAGSLRLSVGAGGQFGGGQSYFILGAGAGYYLVDGLELSLDSEFWIGGDPFVTKLSPGVRYVLHFIPTVKPYVGAFYRHWFVGGGFDDQDSLGVRGGLFLVSGRLYFGVGVAYETLLGCEDDGAFECGAIYPELSLALTL